MTDRLKQIVEKYTLKETDGFEGKKDKETNVEEDLRKNYETGKMVPYQSVIAEGKIIVKPKLEEAKVTGTKLKAISEKSQKAAISIFHEAVEDMFNGLYEVGELKEGKEDKAKAIVEEIVLDFMKSQMEDIQDSDAFDKIQDKVEKAKLFEEEEDED